MLCYSENLLNFYRFYSLYDHAPVFVLQEPWLRFFCETVINDQFLVIWVS